ncbi:MAG: hypothetical protein HPY50_07945 [Firmicutes bacterium]|nr:hypothetical protein [Bacillota bacterium]
MRCENARERFSPWLDGELAPIELEAMKEHLASCPNCRAEIDTWQAISASLKGMARSYTAPAGFSAAVIGQLQTPDRQKSRANIRRWAIGAAAAVIMVSSSAGLAYHYLNTPVPPAINQPGPSSVAVNPGTSPAADPIPAPPAGQGTENPVPPSTGTVVAPTAPTTPNTTEDPPAAPSEPVKIADNTVQPKTFLSTEKVITTTMLKIKAPDPGAAFGLTGALGRTYSASTQVLAQQTDQKYVVKFVVPIDQEAGLMAGLSRLGTTRDQTTDRQDVTAVFTETLETYRETVSELNQTTDENQRKELAERVKYLENLLSTWDKESGKRIIVLWIEA